MKLETRLVLRPHRGGLDASMAEMRICGEPTLGAIVKALNEIWHSDSELPLFNEKNTYVKEYDEEDERIGWKKTCLVMSSVWMDEGKFGPVAMTNFLPKEVDTIELKQKK